MSSFKRALITGVAGFIGFNLANRLLKEGWIITGIDNLNEYYDVGLKKARVQLLENHKNFDFSLVDISDRASVSCIFHDNDFDVVVNFAAQAGVRYSIENPISYVESNLVGFANILEGCRSCGVKHFVYASSSSVYGSNTKMPFSEMDFVDRPVSLYAATKKSNELMAHSYSHLFGLPCSGLRFFTVYGPWGRPDMALFKFVDAILTGNAIDLYNGGDLKRDFTYIEDVLDAVVMVLNSPPRVLGIENEDKCSAKDSCVPSRVLNIGNGKSIPLKNFISEIEFVLGKKAKMNMMPMQAGDVHETLSDLTELRKLCGFTPTTPLREGIKEFVDWFRSYYKK